MFLLHFLFYWPLFLSSSSSFFCFHFLSMMSQTIAELRRKVRDAKNDVDKQWDLIYKALGLFFAALSLVLWHVTPTKGSCIHFWMPIVMLVIVALPFTFHFAKLLLKVGTLEALLKRRRTTLEQHKQQEERQRQQQQEDAGQQLLEESMPRSTSASSRSVLALEPASPLDEDDDVPPRGSKVYLIVGITYIILFLFILALISVKLTCD